MTTLINLLIAYYAVATIITVLGLLLYVSEKTRDYGYTLGEFGFKMLVIPIAIPIPILFVLVFVIPFVAIVTLIYPILNLTGLDVKLHEMAEASRRKQADELASIKKDTEVS